MHVERVSILMSNFSSSFPPAPPRQVPPRQAPAPRSAPTPAPAPALLHNPFVSSGTPTLPPSFTPYPPLVASSAGSSQGATFQPSVLLPPPSASSSSSQPWGQTPSLPPRTPIAPPPSFTSYPSPSAPPAPQARLARSASDSNTLIRQIISQLPMMLELGLSATEDAIQPLEKYSVGILRENASVFRNLVSQVKSKLEGSVLSPEDAKSAEVILLKLERILEKIEGPAGGTSNHSRSELDALSGKGFVAERASILAPVPSVFQNLYLYDSKQIFNTLYAEKGSIQLAHRQYFEEIRQALVNRGSSDTFAEKAIGIIDSILNPVAGGGASVSLGIPAPVPAPGFNATSTPVAAPVASAVVYVQAEHVILRGTELIAALGQLRLNSGSIAEAEDFLRENSDAIRQDLDSSRPQLQRLYTEANSISDSDTKRSVKEVLCSLDGTLKGSNSFFRF